MSITNLEHDLELTTDLLNDEELDEVSGGLVGSRYNITGGCIRFPGIPTIFNPYPTPPFRDVFQKPTIG